MPKRIEEQIRVIPAVETEAHFVQVSRKVLGADLVPCSDHATLEQGERGFNRVVCNSPMLYWPSE